MTIARYFVVVTMLITGCYAEVEIDPGDSVQERRQFCGDGACNHKEQCSTCPQDCGVCVQPPDAAVSKPDASALDAPQAPSCGVGPTTTTFTPSGPITLSSGQTISGLHITNPNGPCITGTNVSNVRITNNKIGPCGSNDTGVGVNLWASSQVRVDHNHIEDVASGFYAAGGSSGGLVFDHNYTTKARGPYPRGQMVQFNGVNGPGHEIACNVSDQAIGGYGAGAGPEDHINMYETSGTAASPVLVRYNKVRGGGNPSGGGILCGDGYGGGAYVVIESNILVDPGQYGVAISGGHNNKLLNNKVYARQNPWTNVGSDVWSWLNIPCSGHEVRGNRVNYTNRDGVQNPWWNGGNCGAIAGETDNAFGDTSIGPAIWDETFPQCCQ